jgi:thioredoxin reductase (NADPH)
MIKTDTLIIGAGPVGLFCVHQLGIIGLKCEVVDNLDKIGGQCIELYPDKPIYDIPAIPECTGGELTNNLIEQIKAFKTNFHLNERVEEVKNIEKKWLIKTNKGTEFEQILYSIKDKKIFKDKTVTIFGGGDSALDWAIELSNTSKVILIHRRDEFRGMQASIDKVNQLKDEGKIEVHTKYQLGSVSGNEKVESINIKHDDESIKEIKTDYVLGFFGLIMQLGPIAEWGLNLDKKTVPVNTENFETNKEGIFAIGDICSYPGKLKLILSGFHEGALAARGCFKYAKPDEKYRFEFTTSSKIVKSRLGVKE